MSVKYKIVDDQFEGRDFNDEVFDTKEEAREYIFDYFCTNGDVEETDYVEEMLDKYDECFELRIEEA